VIFRALFLWAIFRGILDALLRRPDVKRRILEVMLKRMVRSARAHVNPAMNQLSELSRNFYLLSKKYEKETEKFGREA
jgi:hypothetical protein